MIQVEESKEEEPAPIETETPLVESDQPAPETAVETTQYSELLPESSEETKEIDDSPPPAPEEIEPASSGDDKELEEVKDDDDTVQPSEPEASEVVAQDEAAPSVEDPTPLESEVAPEPAVSHRSLPHTCSMSMANVSRSRIRSQRSPRSPKRPKTVPMLRRKMIRPRLTSYVHNSFSLLNYCYSNY